MYHGRLTIKLSKRSYTIGFFNNPRVDTISLKGGLLQTEF